MKNKLLLLTMGFALTIQIISAQVPSYVPTNGLVGWYPFSGNTNDLSGNGLNGSPNNVIYDADRFGNINSCFNVNGDTNRWVDVSISNLDIVNQQSKTFSFWIKLPVNYSSYWNHIITAAPSGIYTQIYGEYPTLASGFKNKLGFTSQNPISNFLFNDDMWHNVVVVCSDNSHMNLYIDGVLNGSEEFPTKDLTNINQIRIGNNLGNLSECAFAGKIDDVGIWNRALTQEEITAMYNGVEYSETCNAVSGSLVDGLVAYYPFCGNAKDGSGNSNNGTVNGATLTTDRFGNTNTAYSFNGTDNYISTNPLTLKSFSLSAWIYNTSVNPLNLNSIISNLNAIPYEGIEFRVDDDSTLQLVCGLATDWSHSTTTFKLLDNTWYNVIATSDNSNVKIYVNSQQIASYSISNFTNNTSNLLFGTRNPFASNGGWYTGKIDDIGIWNRALSQVEISNLYNSNICYQNITVNDTLVINTGILSYNPVTFNNTVTIYPNPANDKITIDCGNLDNVNGWSIKIFNTLGQEVFSGAMNTQKYVLPLNTWGGQGIYFVKIYDSSNNLMNTKKIILN